MRIEEVVGDFVTLNKKGANLIGNCPFHNEKTPSFTVSPVKGIYKCFGCGVGGNSIKFLMEHKHLNYPEALKYIAAKYNIVVEESDPDPKQKEKQNAKADIIEFNGIAMGFFVDNLNRDDCKEGDDYIKSRFKNETIIKWIIGYAQKSYTAFYDYAIKEGYKDDFLLQTGLVTKSKKNGKLYDFFQNRVIFPIFDMQGKLISFTGRILPSEEKNNSKWMNLADSPTYNKSKVLYGLNEAIGAISNTKTVTLVEGNPDCVKLHELGITNTVAPSGTALADGHIKLLKRFADKIMLLYDGDPAGQAALIKNGLHLVKSGLIPYAAVLPEKEDPDSFFTSEDHFNKWSKENSHDFINWYSTKLLVDVGNDPSLKNDAINAICDLLINVTKMKRELYIETISAKSKIKAKMFADRFKELDTVNVTVEKPKTFLPKDIDPNDFEKWGFYEDHNSYHFRSKQGIEKLSNFVMKPVFHIDSAIDSKRIYELVNEHGYSVVVNLDMNEMVSLQGFQRNVESKGNFMFWGQMSHFQKLKLKLYEETRTCIEVKNLGWQKEGFWAWANGMINKEGNFVEIDKYGVVNHNKLDYFIPAFSKIYLKDKSIFLDERKFQYRKSDLEFETWMKQYLKVHGDNAMIGFAWYISALFRDHILYLNDNFPLLNLFGEKGSGKNTMAYSLLSLFGKKQTEFNIHNGTKPGLAKYLETFRNSVAFIDEYKNSLDFDKIETLKSIYNSIGRSRINMDKGGKKETTEVNQGVIFAGQEMPTIDIALSSRAIMLVFLSKEGLPTAAKKDFEHLQELERDGLPHITAEFLKHRSYFIEYFKENYEIVMRKLTDATKGEDINDRLLRNICTVLASFKTLESKFNFPFNFQKLFNFSLEVTRAHNKQISQSDEIGMFWNLLEALFDDNVIIDKWHFNIKMITSLITTKGNTLNFEGGKRILRFKFNAIAKIYSEHLRRSGEKPLPKDSLRHYLTTNKYFIAIDRACKFYRKDFMANEGKIIEQKQTTSAFCFDYDLLSIDLERDLAEAKPKNDNINDSDYRTEPVTIDAHDDELPF